MALIECPECGREVSDKARACPKCACPLRRVQLIEQTGKLWKAVQLFGALASIAGTVTACAGINAGNGSSSTTPVGFLILVLGLVVFVVGRIGGWWYHG